MKFNRELPKHSGMYWYVDKDYPDPQICYLMVCSCTMYPIGGGATVLKQVHYENYRWGDTIVKPRCIDNEVEN